MGGWLETWKRGNVPALDHEVGDYPVEDGVVVVVPRGERCEVGAGLFVLC